MFDDSFEHEAGFDEKYHHQQQQQQQQCSGSEGTVPAAAAVSGNTREGGSESVTQQAAASACTEHYDTDTDCDSLSQRRVVLVTDIWHPDFSNDEVSK